MIDKLKSSGVCNSGICTYVRTDLSQQFPPGRDVSDWISDLMNHHKFKEAHNDDGYEIIKERYGLTTLINRLRGHNQYADTGYGATRIIVDDVNIRTYVRKNYPHSSGWRM
jgi:hypothetical protein